MYVSENVIKIGGQFGVIFLEKAWDIFQKLAYFYNAHNSKIICRKQLKFST